MTVTLGALLQRLERERETPTKFAFFMPTANGPCRFGAYHILHRIVLNRLGWGDRVRLWSPADSDYFQGLPAGFDALVFTGFMASDLLLEALYDARPSEVGAGAALAVYEVFRAELLALLEREAARDLTVPSALWQAAGGACFGAADLLARAARKFAAVRGPSDKPVVLLVGEIYVRCDPFSNGFAVDRLEERGLKCRFAPTSEWIEYTDIDNVINRGPVPWSKRISHVVRGRIQDRLYAAIAGPLRWPARTTVPQSMDAGGAYVRPELSGEAILTVGGPVHEWREGIIDGVVNLGPHECMPSKVAEAQFFHVAEREGLLSVSIPLNGDPVDPQVWDSFAWEVHNRRRRRQTPSATAVGARPPVPVPAGR